MKQPLIFTTLLVLLLSLTSSPASSEDTIRIGVSLGLTGRFAAPAEMQEKGYRLWERDVNKRGGILGKKVEMIIRDDEGSPEKSRAIYRDFFDRGLDLVFAPYQSDIAYAATGLIEKYGYPTLAPGASDDRIWQRGFKNIFGVYSPASRYFIGFLELIASKRLKTVAIAYANTGWSKTAAAGAEKWAGEFGLYVVYKKLYANNDDIMKIAGELKTLKPDAIVLCSYLEDSVAFVKALKALNYFPKAFSASVGPAMPEFSERLGIDAEHVFGASLWEPNYRLPYPDIRAFINDFNKTYGHEPSYHAAATYAAGMILEKAVIKAGSLNKSRIKDALQDMNILTLLGIYRVDARGLQVGHRPITLQWQKGKKEIVWPRAMQTASPIIGAK